MKMILIGGFAIVILVVLGMSAWVLYASNVERPDYAIAIADGVIVVRDYPSMIVAEVSRRGDRQSAVSSGFRPLADYIFAKERSGPAISMTAPVTQRREQIAMTAPVTQSRTEDDDASEWAVRFIMPSAYTLDSLPQSANADIRLLAVPASKKAVIRFSGVVTDELIEKHEDQLRKWIAKRGLTVVEPPTYAYYNPPFTPGFLRRNEVMIDLAE